MGGAAWLPLRGRWMVTAQVAGDHAQCHGGAQQPGGRGHKDPRTTRRYDHARDSLDRNAAYAVAAYLA